MLACAGQRGETEYILIEFVPGTKLSDICVELWEQEIIFQSCANLLNSS